MENLYTGIQVEGGWEIDFNILIEESFDPQETPFDSTILFNAINHITGKSISISYEYEPIGYVFESYQRTRESGVWNNKGIHEILQVSPQVPPLYKLMQHYLNPQKKNLTPLKIGGWRIIHNNLLKEPLYDDIELLFSATRGKLFIDVVYYKHNEKPFYIYMGLSHHKYLEFSYKLDKPVRESKEIYLEKTEDVVELINNFLVSKTFP